jgi:hydrogenase maturation protease
MKSSHIQPQKILIIGVGNTLRCDDGIGAYICHHIDALKLQNVTTLIVQQLQVEIIEELLGYDAIIIADASVGKNEVEFNLLMHDEMQTTSSSHHTNANMLYALAEKMYHQKMLIYLCSVPAENFEMGEILSQQAIINANKAIALIQKQIKSLTIDH